MRNIWLENIETGATWDLLPKDPYITDGGCPFVGISGFGYQQDITQNQVGVDYFISAISTKNTQPTGTLIFQNDKHIKRFQEFVGDFRKQLRLYYSPDGQFEIGDQISAIYYKRVTISRLDKTEKKRTGVYECPAIFTPQEDVWKRDFIYRVNVDTTEVGDPLIYPYTYPYIFGGRSAIQIEIANSGRETGCVVSLKNKSGSQIRNVEWFCDHVSKNQYGVEKTDTQRAKFYVSLSRDTELVVDSNALTQEATVKNLTDETSQSVVSQQEPSWNYINFIQLKHGTNRFVFYVDNIQNEIELTVQYTEQKEII